MHHHALVCSQVARKPEIMSPAGYWPQLHAAVEAGADSVYFGLNRFSARAKVGFILEEMPEVMQTLHKRGVRGYLTFNTLVFEDELQDAASTIASLAEAGVDALIVQDVGIVRLARQIAPWLELHASTQMSITDSAGVRFAQNLGCSRVTLARELSLKDLGRIASETQCDLEVFVHGALCVAYSGQCFSSEAWGGRSANRGQCAQACRMPYELVVDGEVRPTGDARYLLSPEDLYALEQVPQLAEIGIAALKIEGRYKDADYVALTTRAYREAVDGVAQDRAAELAQVYSRGFGPHFVSGVNHQAVVKGRSPRHRGVFLGKVVRFAKSGVVVTAEVPIKPGDGIVFDAADWRSPQESEEGGRVFEILPQAGNSVELRFANGAIDRSRIRKGDWVWRTNSVDTERAAKPFTTAANPVRLQDLSVHVTAREGEVVHTEFRAGRTIVHNQSLQVVEKATNRGITEDVLKEQLGRLGGTPYWLRSLTSDIEGNPFIPVSVLNQIRREAVEKLQEAQAALAKRPVFAPQLRIGTPTLPMAPQLHLLVRSEAQLDAALLSDCQSIMLDFLDLYGVRKSVAKVRNAGREVRIATPRVLKPDETKILDFLRSLECPILVRSAAMLERLQGTELVGDFSLNTANSQTAAAYLDLGCSRLTPTHDLNARQVERLARDVGAHRIEVALFHHLPVFHTEHCVFCRFLSTGTTHLDCGRPCETHEIALRDERGRSHPVVADVGCRNTVFGAEAQQPGAHLQSWLAAGIGHYRIEFAHETPEQVRSIAQTCYEAITGQLKPADFVVALRRTTPGGVTEGSLTVPELRILN